MAPGFFAKIGNFFKKAGKAIATGVGKAVKFIRKVDSTFWNRISKPGMKLAEPLFENVPGLNPLLKTITPVVDKIVGDDHY